MKSILICCISALCCLGSLLAADFDPPRNAFSGAEIQAAMQQAASDQRSILLMYYDYRKGDPAWKRRSMDVLGALDSSCIVVYVDSSEYKLLTGKAREELSGDKLGSTYPRAVIMDATLGELIYPIPQHNWTREFDTTIREAKREAQAHRIELRRRAEMRTEKAAEATVVEAPVERTWTDTQGRTLQATLNVIQADTVKVMRDNGLSASIPLEMLSEADHNYLKKYSGSLFDKSGL